MDNTVLMFASRVAAMELPIHGQFRLYSMLEDMYTNSDEVLVS